MASMKTMMMMALDVAPSMTQPVSSDSKYSKLELAKAFMGHFVLQRMMASKTAEFAVATFGDDETNNFLNESQGGYENVNQVCDMARASPQTLEALRGITAGSQAGDLIDGVVVCQDVLMRVNAGKAFNRLLLLVTDGETEVQGVEDLEAVVDQMKTIRNFAVYIAMIGKTRDDSTVVKQQNAQLLRSIAENVNGRYMEIEALGESFHLLSGGLGLGTKPVVSKTVLEVSPHLRIPVCYWSKVSKATAPTLKKHNKLAGDADTAVKRDINYRDPEDPDQVVPDEERVKGYKYGGQYVPVNSADEEKFKIPGSPLLQVIGFVPRDSLPRFHFLDGPTYVYPSQELDAAQLAMQAFVSAMVAKGKAALVRFVKRENSDPALMALLPKTDEKGRACFLMHRVPCAEDVREFNFPSLISFASESQVRSCAALSAQKAAAEELVRSLTVPQPSVSQLCPANPSLHRVFAELHRRSLNETREHMVEVERGFSPLNTPSTAAALQRMRQQFPLRRAEKKADRKKIFWSDIEIKTDADAAAGAGGGRVKIEIDGQQIAAALSGQSQSLVAAAQESEAVVLPDFTAGSVTPVEDLDQLVEAIKASSLAAEEKKQRVSEACKVMTKVVERNVTVGASKPHYKRAVECLAALRRVSVSEQSEEVFNNFLRNTMKAGFSKGRHSLAWQLTVEEKLSLISSAEVSHSAVSPTEANQFLNDTFVVEAPVTAVVVADEEDDLFGNME